MGRLFWKFFLFLMLGQVATVVGVSSAIWLRHRNAAAQTESASAPAAATLLDEAGAALRRGGEAELRSLLEQSSHAPGPRVHAVDERGREILGRAVVRAPAGTEPRPPPPGPGIRHVTLPDGSVYALFVERPGPPERRGGPERGGLGGPPDGPGVPSGPGGPDRPPRPGPSLFPVEPIAGGLVASLVVAALLASYVSKPIRSLRRAFDAAAQGDLGARIGDSLGRRRDELADLGRDFDRTAARLKLLMDGQRRLLHDVSHELRSPLARLQAAIGLARQQPGNVEASMDRIERESMRMDKLVDELLTLSRMEAGLGASGTESVDVVELVCTVVKDAAFEADAGSTPVTFDLDLDSLVDVDLKGNPELLNRALENVVRNAARHTPAGGRVHVVGRRDAQRHQIELTVADEGPGVAADELESIFMPFYRGRDAMVSRGHGLGLAIARRVADAHGGSIVAANRPSGGLAVAIRLPV